MRILFKFNRQSHGEHITTVKTEDHLQLKARLKEALLQRKIKALRRKQAEFEAKGDFSQATHAKIIADFLEDYAMPEPTATQGGD